MKLNVLVFGQLADVVGSAQAVLELELPCSVADLKTEFVRAYPLVAELDLPLLCALNQEVVSNQAQVCADQEVALFPPVTGG